MNPATPKIPENLTYQAASGDAVPKSVLNATRVIKATQTTKKYERHDYRKSTKMASGAIRIFQTCQFFSPIDGPSMAHRWAVHGKAFLDPNFTHGWPMGGPCMAMHGSPWDLSTGMHLVRNSNSF